VGTLTRNRGPTPFIQITIFIVVFGRRGGADTGKKEGQKIGNKIKGKRNVSQKKELCMTYRAKRRNSGG